LEHLFRWSRSLTRDVPADIDVNTIGHATTIIQKL